MIHVLGLLARAGHGKSTIVNYLASTYGVRTMSLAAPLKKIAKAVMDFDDSQLYGTQAQKEAVDEAGARDAKGRGLSARIFLQKLGTEGIREHLGELTFCEGLANNVAKDYATITEGIGAVYGVDDMRFPNEAAFIHGLDTRPHTPLMFGHVVKIVCTDAPPSGNDNHPSEAGVDRVAPEYIDHVIVSSRAQGVHHLIGELEAMLALPKFSGLRMSLKDSKARFTSLGGR